MTAPLQVVHLRVKLLCSVLRFDTMFLDVSMSVKKSLQFSMSRTLKTELSSQLLFRLRFQFVVIEVF